MQNSPFEASFPKQKIRLHEVQHKRYIDRQLSEKKFEKIKASTKKKKGKKNGGFVSLFSLGLQWHSTAQHSTAQHSIVTSTARPTVTAYPSKQNSHIHNHDILQLYTHIISSPPPPFTPPNFSIVEKIVIFKRLILSIYPSSYLSLSIHR